MANPQLENGYIKIAVEIFEALARIRISGEARQVLDFIIRKTYGWNKKQDQISLSQFILGTNIKKSEVIRAIKKLEIMNLIGKKANDEAIYKGNIYMFNKDFERWKPLAKKQTIGKKANDSLAKKPKVALAKKPHTKDTIDTIDTNTKDINTKIKDSVSPKADSRIKILIDHFHDKYIEILNEPGTPAELIAKPKITGQAGAMFKRLLKDNDLEILKEGIVGFLKDKSDKFIIKRAWPISAFEDWLTAKKLKIQEQLKIQRTRTENETDQAGHHKEEGIKHGQRE